MTRRLLYPKRRPPEQVVRRVVSLATSAALTIAGPIASTADLTPNDPPQVGIGTSGGVTSDGGTAEGGTSHADTAGAAGGVRLGPRWRLPLTGALLPSSVIRRFEAPVAVWAPGHRGVDLASEPGSSVVSPAAGVVTFVGVIAGRGVVVIGHPDGLRSSLEPVAATATVGAPVAAGAVVGLVSPGAADSAGADHCRSGTCVHWGVRRGETYLDPLLLVQTPALVLLPVPLG